LALSVIEVACNPEVVIDGAVDRDDAKDPEHAPVRVAPEILAKSPDDRTNTDANQHDDRDDAGTFIVWFASLDTPNCYRQLRGERNGSRPRERLSKPGKHGEVGVNPYSVDATVRSAARPYSCLSLPNSRSTAPRPR